jgi:hypothetical protein
VSRARDKAQQWLGHRPTDRRGLPIPYINRWGPETDAGTHIRFDPSVGMPAYFHDDVGDTVDFTRQSFQRQRECMVLGRCQVCARQVPWSRRFVPVSSVTTAFVTLPGIRRPVGLVSEPWLDERCAEIAARWCPELIRRSHDDLLIHPVTRSADVQLLTSVGWLDGEREAVTRADPPAMWVKLALVNLELRQGAA